MSTKVLMSVEEYLHTSFEPAAEYLDGEVVERNAGEFFHSAVLGTVLSLLHPFRRTLGIRIAPVIHIRITPTRYRVADIGVWPDDSAGMGFPTKPPFLGIEILAPEDRLVRMVSKVEEYLSIGVQWIWIIDPQERAALYYSHQQPQGTACTILRTENPRIEIPLESAFDLDA